MEVFGAILIGLAAIIGMIGVVAFTRDHIIPLFRRKGGKVIPMRRSRLSRGYTLIELMITIAITGIVVMLLVGVVALVTILVLR